MRPPVFVRCLTAKERDALSKIASSSTDGKETRKALTVQLSSQGKTVPEIARTLSVSSASILRWVHAFTEKGISFIPTGKSPGRPRIADEEFEDAVMEALSTSPKDYGYDATIWTAELLRGHLSLEKHVLVCERTIYHVLHRLNYVFKRPKLDLRHKQDPKEVSRAKREKTLAKKTS